jgi:DNA-binding CsgD family transcriptional regulator
MHEAIYPQVGQTLRPHQLNLIERLQQAAQACAGLEMMTLNELNQLAQSLADAFFIFLQHPQGNAPYHLGEMLNQARATPMFLSLVNKTMRDFCFDHLPETSVPAGLEATADFFLFIIQTYIQSNQSVLIMATLNHRQQEQLRQQFTANELSTLKYLAQGKTNKQIARAMNVTERSVVNYLQQARQKLGTTGRTDTMVAAMHLMADNG